MCVRICTHASESVQQTLCIYVCVHKTLVNKYYQEILKVASEGLRGPLVLEDEEGNVCFVGMIALLIVLLLARV